MKIKAMETIEINGVRAGVARTFWQRFKGLMGRESLPPGEGMLIQKCNSIHTCFMRFAIDATFLDKDDQVIGYKFVSLGKMTDFIKNGDDPNTAWEKASGSYGRVQDAVKFIDPRKE